MIGLNNMQLAELVARVRAGTGELVSRGRGFSLDLQHSVALVIFCSSLGPSLCYRGTLLTSRGSGRRFTARHPHLPKAEDRGATSDTDMSRCADEPVDRVNRAEVRSV